MPRASLLLKPHPAWMERGLMDAQDTVIQHPAEEAIGQEERLFDHHQASVYRTRWLMAHNFLYDLLQNPEADRNAIWHAYVTELQSSGDMTEQQAA
ncbi:MAG TPA: hypothetical protein VHZ28_01665 [Terracidiphilus sp.]|nr:hypothetical protein [Terracidiphilus sp.]